MALSRLHPLSSLILPLLLAAGARAGPPKEKDTIIQLFEWPWDSISDECALIGKLGYGYVQVSPPAEHITGAQWWTDYQPVSYQLTSKRGDRAQFSSMVSTCEAAGVDVLVDAVTNHMSAGSETDTQTGYGGSQYTKYNYPGLYDASSFHYCAGNGVAGGIDNWDNATQVWDCELVGLSDLDSENTTVQATIAAYLSDLASIGVAGFRMDAAKDINNDSLAAIVSQVQGDTLYYTQETIFGEGEAVQPEMYTSIGDAQEFRATADLLRIFTSDGIAYFGAAGNGTLWGQPWGYVPSDVANFFVANHDTERSGFVTDVGGGTATSLNSTSANNAYTLAHIFSLGWDYGTFTVLSSYNTTSNDMGAPGTDSGGSPTAVTCGDGWMCQHRWPAIANMVGFRNAASGTQVGSITASEDDPNRLAFARGQVGYVALNNDAEAWSATLTTPLPAGKYCNLIDATIADTGDVTCATYITLADDGSFDAQVGAYSAVAFYVNGPQ